MNQSFIYLASASPRRRALLSQIGVAHQVHAVDIDESQRAGEPAAAYVDRLAVGKAQAAVAELGRDIPVLAADTVVVTDGEALGKPGNRQQGLQMLEKLSGGYHSVLTAVALIDRRCVRSILCETQVVFRPIDAQERSWYWETGEPADKAGGYAIQGYAAMFIERIEGSYSGVMGLPLFETANLLRQSGLSLMQPVN